jgi:hypothetical protein
MIRSSAAILARLSWTELPHHHGCELKRNDQLIGSLQHSSKRASDYVASTSEGEWTFRRIGFWGSAAEILDRSCLTIATFKPIWPSRGALTFSDGQGFYLECKGLWHPVWTVRTQSAERVLSLHVREQTIDFGDVQSISNARLWLLAMFVLYRVQQAEEDAASAAIVAGIA